MKIIMFSDVYGSVTTTFIRNEVDYFGKKHDLIYLAQKTENSSGGIKTHCIPFVESLFKRKLNWYLWKLDLTCSFRNAGYARQLNDFIRGERPDVIHCHFAYEALKLLQNIDTDLTMPVFVHFHGYDASEMLRKRSYVKALTDSFSRKRVFPIVVSRKMKADLEKLGIPMESAEILRYGVDLALFNVSSDPGKDKIFAQISSLTEKKGHEYTLHALDLFFKRNPSLRNEVKLVIAGMGELESHIKTLIRDLGLSNNVSLVGKVNKDQAVDLLAKASVFVHHSITARNGDQEGIPNAIIEAMAMKLPVLSTWHAGIPELVQHGVNGLLCNEKDVQTYAKQMEEILAWPKLDINRSVVERDYNIEKHNHQLEVLYRSKLVSLPSR